MLKSTKPTKSTAHELKVNRQQGPNKLVLQALAETGSRKLPRFHSPGVRAHPEVIEAAGLLKIQWKQSQVRVMLIVARALAKMGKKKMLEALAFLRSQASFYDVHLLLNDPSTFEARRKMWSQALQAKRRQIQTNVDIGKTVELDTLYTRTVTNESNMYAGRNTLANIPSE